MNEEQLTLWNETEEAANAGTISVEVLDQSVRDYAMKRADYEAKKKVSTDAHGEAERAKAKVMALLKQAGKSRYSVDGVGNVSVIEKTKVRMPADLVGKDAFFTWLQAEGSDVFNHYATVNYNSLNSLYKQKFEEASEEGTADTFAIPGVAEPETETNIQFRKQRN